MALATRLLIASIWLPLLVLGAAPEVAPRRALFRGAGLGPRADLELTEVPVGTDDAGLPSLSAAQQQRRKVLDVFQVAQPVLGENGLLQQTMSQPEIEVKSETVLAASAARASCSQVLMRHDFGWSYGKPFIGDYKPPDCEFNRVIFNFTVVSQGRQFDRLAIMYVGDTEVWRPSTAEPRAPPGIRWTYWKEMTQFLYFWKSPQKLIFDLGNLIDDKYTGYFNTTLTAHFFQSDVEVATAPPADLIIPISQRNGSAGGISAWNLPEQPATNTIGDFPRNVNRAVFSVSANGQIGEEFFWSNVLESDADFTKGVGGTRLPALSPFREVQVLIDGQLAGVSWPFPIIFTGGISPTFHRPIVGLQAFELREHEIDITPFLPILCDGKQHNFEIRVGGINDLGPRPYITDKTSSYWVVSGKIFIWLDKEGSVTTGEAPTIFIPDPVIDIQHKTGKNAEGLNETLQYQLIVRRSISINGKMKTSKGEIEPKWLQSLAFRNSGDMVNFGNDGINEMNTTGMDVASGHVDYRTMYHFPLWVNSSYREDSQGTFSIKADLYQGLDLEVEGAAVYPDGLEAFAALPETAKAKYSASKLTTFRNGSATFWQTADGKNGSATGNTHQIFEFGGISKQGMLGNRPEVVLYSRDVFADADEVVRDKETVAGVAAAALVAPQEEALAAAAVDDFAFASDRVGAVRFGAAGGPVAGGD